MVDISLSDDESLAAAVKEDFGPNQELGAKERLSNWFVDIYGRHLLCSVKIRQPYWITTNFSTRLFSDNGSNEFATLSRKRWTPDSDLYLIPILADEHWTMVAANMTEMTMYYFDSFNGKRTTVESVRGSCSKLERVLAKMFTSGMPGIEKLAGINSDEDGERQFLIGEPAHTERGFEWEKHGWTFVVLQLESRQTNTYDCGVFMLAFAKSQVLKEKYNATQKQMAEIRRMLSREMRNKRLEPSLVDQNN
ncbi:cysteine proteinase [Ramicandelaber brevisporus]|nr:cysteine proteinase [Ramicandelaber brevisporus]